MHSFIFTIHHECSYVDGMVVINADDYDQAEAIFRNTTWREAMKPGMGKDWDESQLDEYIIDREDLEEDQTDKILREYPEKLPKEMSDRFFNVWCLIQKIPVCEHVRAFPLEAGFVALAYHDG